MSFSIILPSRFKEEQTQSVQDQVSSMSMEELEHQVFEDSMLLGYLSEFGQKCQFEIDRRGSIHRLKINQNSVFGAFDAKVPDHWYEWKTKQSIPIVRKVVPGLIASELVGVQPMSGFSDLPTRNIKFQTFTSMGWASDEAGWTNGSDPLTATTAREMEHQKSYGRQKLDAYMKQMQATQNGLDNFWGTDQFAPTVQQKETERSELTRSILALDMMDLVPSASPDIQKEIITSALAEVRKMVAAVREEDIKSLYYTHSKEIAPKSSPTFDVCLTIAPPKIRTEPQSIIWMDQEL